MFCGRRFGTPHSPDLGLGCDAASKPVSHQSTFNDSDKYSQIKLFRCKYLEKNKEADIQKICSGGVLHSCTCAFLGAESVRSGDAK